MDNPHSNTIDSATNTMILPNFIIIGAYKSGTTSLYHYLRQHPDIFMPSVKEPNFFAHEKKAMLMQQEGKAGNPINNIDTYAELFSTVENEKAIGEASPLYLGTPLAAQRIKETIPQVKLIAILRQPIEAFYSDHNMRIRDKRKLENDFRERVKGIEKRINVGEISGPMYYKQLKVYYDLYGADRIKVCLYDDLKKDNIGLIKSIYEFLDVDASFSPHITERHNAGGLAKSINLNTLLKRALKKQKVKNTPWIKNTLLKLQQTNTSPFPPLSADLRRELTEVYREDIENLAKLIDRDLNAWLS